MANFNERIKQHLAEYKVQRLGVSECGLWRKNGQPYSHILPGTLYRLNIIETYRREFWKFFESPTAQMQRPIKLHSDFAHLNSSQALGFNLFFPFLAESHLALLATVLGFPGETVQHTEFEGILDPTEATNFDFYARLQSGTQVLVELKLTEGEFGTAADDASHRHKLATIYEPLLRGSLDPHYLAPSEFFQHYQLLRNISYLQRDPSTVLILLFPSGNKALSVGIQRLWPALATSLTSRIRIVSMEDFVKTVQQTAVQQPSSQQPLPPVSSAFLAHYTLLQEKYLV